MGHIVNDTNKEYKISILHDPAKIKSKMAIKYLYP